MHCRHFYQGTQNWICSRLQHPSITRAHAVPDTISQGRSVSCKCVWFSDCRRQTPSDRLSACSPQSWYNIGQSTMRPNKYSTKTFHPSSFDSHSGWLAELMRNTYAWHPRHTFAVLSIWMQDPKLESNRIMSPLDVCSIKSINMQAPEVKSNKIKKSCLLSDVIHSGQWQNCNNPEIPNSWECKSWKIPDLLNSWLWRCLISFRFTY